MTTFDDATPQSTVMNLCVDDVMTLIQLLKQMQNTDRYKNVSKQLVYNLHGRFSNAVTDSFHRVTAMQG